MKRHAAFDLFLPLAYSNVWLAASAGGLAYVSLLAAGRKTVDVPAVVLPVLIMYVVYTFDKVLKLDPVADAANDPARTAFVTRWRTPLLALAAGALVGGAALAWTRGVATLVLFLVPFPIAIAYGTPILPARFRYRRLKDITGGKSLTVALTWALTATTLPLVAAGTPLGPTHWLLFGWVSLRMLFNTVFFDIGDLEGDREAGIQTLPVVMGAERTHRLLTGSIVMALVVGIALTFVGARRELIGAVVVVGAVYDFSVQRAAARDELDMGVLCDLGADAYGIVAGAAALASALGGA